MTALDFSTVRPLFGGKLTQPQVDGINTILAGWDKYGDGDKQKLAYLLATTKLETASTMQPIVEYGAKSYFDKYNAGTKLGKALGNTEAGDGYRYRGRGYVMITGRANYARAGKKLGIDLVGYPERATEPSVAIRIAIAGSGEGWFTGKKLSDYIDGIDESDDEDLREYVQTRRVINGQDKALKIGQDALVFERALGVSQAPAKPVNSIPTQTIGEKTLETYEDDLAQPPDGGVPASPVKVNWHAVLVVAGLLVVLGILLFVRF